MKQDFENPEAVIVSLNDLKSSSVFLDTLEEAFGPSSLGILLVKDLPVQFPALRHELLSYASYLANLPSDQLELLSSPSSQNLLGWSHGKEKLNTSDYDTLKGSYYVNCAVKEDMDLRDDSTSDFSEYGGPNIWPPHDLLPGFQQKFKELCNLIIDVAILVARACDRYAVAHIEGYELGCLENIIKNSTTTKGRLLHYFSPHTLPLSDPPFDSTASTCGAQPAEPTVECPDGSGSWCSTHIDHGCLTGLTSALFIDEGAHPPHVQFDVLNPPSVLPPLPFLNSPPDPSTGLYIHSRNSTITKVNVPPDCLAFQTGEALQLLTQGKFRAVPHFVRYGCDKKGGSKIVRNTLAVFTQPNLKTIVDKDKGATFEDLCREVAQRFN